MEEHKILQQLVEIIREVSPILWETGRRQVFAIAISDLLWFLVSMAIALLSLKYMASNWRKFSQSEDSDESAAYIVLSIGCMAILFISFLTGMDYGISSFKHFYNPDYHAIQLLLELIR